MLPHNAISELPQTGTYLAPDLTDTQAMQSLESGGVALNDASQGRLVQTWRAWIDTSANPNAIKLSPISGSPVSSLVTGTGFTEIALAFDASMAPTICYKQDGVWKLRWYNTVTQQFQTDAYIGVTSARLSTDDKRASQEGVSDVIFAYTRGGNLYWRQERDRYTIERLIGASEDRVLRRVGMHTKLRMQFELVSA